MKKLLMITLSLLLFTILISPVQAKRPGPLDRPLPDYNNLSLRQIFEDGQLLSYNMTEWVKNNNNALMFYDSNYIRIEKNTSNDTRIYINKNINTVGGNIYWFSADIESVGGQDDVYIYKEGITQLYGFLGIYQYDNQGRISFKYTQYSTSNSLFYLGRAVISTQSYFLQYNGYIVLLDLTALGIPTATKIEMDNLYSDYLKYKDMMNATDVMLIVGQLGAFVWSLVVSFEVFGLVLWEYALFGIGAGFIGYLALKIIQKKAGDDNGDSD